MAKSIPEDIGDYLRYEPETGRFFWIQDVAKNVRAGDEAGAVNRYRIITFRKVPYTAHRIAWFLFYGEQPPPMIDHWDRIETNNRISNLRETTRRDNRLNSHDINPRVFTNIQCAS